MDPYDGQSMMMPFTGNEASIASDDTPVNIISSAELNNPDNNEFVDSAVSSLTTITSPISPQELDEQQEGQPEEEQQQEPKQEHEEPKHLENGPQTNHSDEVLSRIFI